MKLFFKMCAEKILLLLMGKGVQGQSSIELGSEILHGVLSHGEQFWGTTPARGGGGLLGVYLKSSKNPLKWRENRSEICAIHVR